MVRYLNALISNVNYFISQVWSYRLRILPLDEEQPLDYGFRVEAGSEVIADISLLSDGQMEIVNLSWVLTILLQMKILDKIPLFADEIGRTFDPTHRVRMLTFLGQLVDNKIVAQLFIVNHHALFTDGFKESDIIMLSTDDITELPSNTNQHVRML